MNSKTVLTHVEEGVATVTLNRPERLNAFTAEMSTALISAMAAFSADDTVRVLVLNAAGRGFCAGQDLSDEGVAPGSGAVDLGRTLENYYIPLIETITSMPKPVICAVNGVAAGAGASLALACDLVVAARSAFFLQPFANISLLPDAGGTYFLPRALGTPLALGYAMTGERLPAERAAALGMIWKCVADEELATTTAQLAKQLARSAPLALKAIKAAMRSSETRSLGEALRYERDQQRMLGQTKDYAEGVRAFVEKRSARFVGA